MHGDVGDAVLSSRANVRWGRCAPHPRLGGEPDEEAEEVGGVVALKRVIPFSSSRRAGGGRMLASGPARDDKLDAVNRRSGHVIGVQTDGAPRTPALFSRV